MFTQNYINLRYNMFYGSTSKKPIYDYSGEKISIYSNNGYMGDIGANIGNAKIGVYSYHGGVYFGSGITPPTLKDCALESVITSGLEVVTSSRSYADEGNGVYSVFGIYGLKNTGESAITISEIGVFSDFRTGTNLDDYDSSLMERTVLAKPVTIEPGKAKQITYKLTFHH